MKTMINQLFSNITVLETVVGGSMQDEVKDTQKAENMETENGDQQAAEDGVTEGGMEEEATDTEAGTELEGENTEEMPSEDMPIEEGDMTSDGMSDMMAEDGMADITGTETQTQANASLLASYPFVIGISGVTLAVSIVIGILLGKRKIKKGLDLYED